MDKQFMTHHWSMNIAAIGGGNAALMTFLGYTLLVFLLMWVSHRMLLRRKFLNEYYLGSRNLGVFTFTMTFGATAASAGTFAGFPAMIYTHGWVLALWIASYMLVPLCAMGILGIRLNQVSRKSGAITLPELLRERFRSPAISLTATLIMTFMLSFYLIPQFKLAALILQQLLAKTPLLHTAATSIGSTIHSWPMLQTVDPEYLICLLMFAFLVVPYTTFGGFRAVVMTDVLQGVVMVAGVLIMLVLVLSRVGGLENATRKMAEMVPPNLGEVKFISPKPVENNLRVSTDLWFTLDSTDDTSSQRLFRTNEMGVIAAGQRESKLVKVVEIITPQEIEQITQQWPEGHPPALPDGVIVQLDSIRPYAYGANQPGVYLQAPGPSSTLKFGFLSLGMAISFFVYWALSSTGQPGNMVRLMAFNSSKTLRRGIAGLTIYFGLIYIPLVIIFCCSRLIVPGLDHKPDRIMPVLAFEISNWASVPWLGGLLIAAPFAAAMSTVDSFMLMISSSVVRDVYQRNINPDASQKKIKRLSYACMLIIGTVVTFGAINPPQMMQELIIFTSGGLSVTFLAPVFLALFWHRMNTPGTIAAMIGGLTVYLSLNLFVYITDSSYRLLELEPFIWGLLASLIFGIVVSKATKPPDNELVKKYFSSTV